MSLNIDEVKKHIEYFKNDKFYNEFYVGLMIYERLGLDSYEVTEAIIQKVQDKIEEYESIYNEDLRCDIDAIPEEFKEELEEELENEKE